MTDGRGPRSPGRRIRCRPGPGRVGRRGADFRSRGRGGRRGVARPRRPRRPTGRRSRCSWSAATTARCWAPTANVVGGYSAALVSQGGRAAVISVDPAGALVAIQSVPYGRDVRAHSRTAGWPAAPAAGASCRPRSPTGKAVLSAFGLGADGRWTDLSGSDGFVSATDKAVAVVLEDALGAAVQVTDGTTTIWNVLAWNGSEFATLGCGPDGEAPGSGGAGPGRVPVVAVRVDGFALAGRRRVPSSRQHPRVGLGKRARAAEWVSLLMRCALTGTGGSNPLASAVCRAW